MQADHGTGTEVPGKTRVEAMRHLGVDEHTEDRNTVIRRRTEHLRPREAMAVET